MSSLTAAEREYLEELLDMGGGYVLHFTDDSFGGVFERYDIDIHSQRYWKYGKSKAKKLRAFWDDERDSLVGSVLAELIDVYEVQCRLDRRQRNPELLARCQEIVARVSGGAVSPVSITTEGFLAEEFKTPDLEALPVEPAVVGIVHERLEEARACLQVGAHLSVIFQCGSVLEAVLLGAAQRNPRSFNAAASSPKRRDGKPKAFQDWKLSEFIDVAHDIGVLSADVRKFSHGLRDFRNYIHPYQQMASGFTPDEHTAKVCLQVLKAALADVAGVR